MAAGGRRTFLRMQKQPFRDPPNGICAGSGPEVDINCRASAPLAIGLATDAIALQFRRRCDQLIDNAWQRDRSRLAAYRAQPTRHAIHAAKVLLKFKLLEVQRLPWDDFVAWAVGTPYFRLVRQRWFPGQPLADWVAQLYGELAESGAAGREPGFATNH